MSIRDQPNNHPFNDFWQNVRRDTKDGWEGLIPDNPAQMGKEGLGDTLRGLLEYLPVTVRWEGRDLIASLSNGENSMDLESGGFIPEGQVTLYLTKDYFSDGDYPESDDEILLLSQGKWEVYNISNTSETFDEADHALIIVAERDNA